MYNFKKFAVVGSGSWGSAIAAHLARIHESVVIYSDSKEIADEITNKKLIPDILKLLLYQLI